MRAADAGTGIIAGGPMRAIFEALGVQDVVAKSVGSSNPHNMIKATFDGLSSVRQPAHGGAAARQAKCPIWWRRREHEAEAAGVAVMAEQEKDPPCDPGRQPDRAPAKSQRATLIGLGLNKMNRTRELEDTPAVRGMIAKVPSLGSGRGERLTAALGGPERVRRGYQRR